MPNRLEINDAAVRKLVEKEGRTRVKALVDRVAADALYQIPKKTGMTMGSNYTVHAHIENGVVKSEFGFKSVVAWYLHEGTPPHPEPIRRPGPMTFFWEKVGRVVTLAHVNHPGIKPTHFLTGPLAKRGYEHNFEVTITHAPRQ